MKLRAYLAILVITVTVSLAASVQAQNPVGWWAFQSGNPNDLTGNFGMTTLYGAGIVNGQLVVSSANGTYARTQYYTGSTITSKTLLSWVYLDDLGVVGGTAITLEKNVNFPVVVFDGIVYSERQSGTWEDGSSFFDRTQDPPQQGMQELTPGQLIKMAIVYDSNNIITIYRNDVLYSRYSKGALISYSANEETDVIFGARFSEAIPRPGGNYLTHLTQSDVQKPGLTV